MIEAENRGPESNSLDNTYPYLFVEVAIISILLHIYMISCILIIYHTGVFFYKGKYSGNRSK